MTLFRLFLFIFILVAVAAVLLFVTNGYGAAMTLAWLLTFAIITWPRDQGPRIFSAFVLTAVILVFVSLKAPDQVFESLFFGLASLVERVFGEEPATGLFNWLEQRSEAGLLPNGELDLFKLFGQVSLLAAYLVGAFFFAPLYRFVVRPLGIGGLERETVVIAFLRKPAVRVAFAAVFLSCLLIVMLVPRVSNAMSEGWALPFPVFGPTGSPEHIADKLFGLIWAPVVILCAELFAAGSNTSSGLDPLAKLLRSAGRDPKLRAEDAFNDLTRRFGPPALLIDFALPSVQEESKPLAKEDIETNTATGSNSLRWAQEIMLDRLNLDLPVTEAFRSELEKVQSTLNKNDTKDLLLFEDALSFQRLDIFATILRALRDKGMGVLVLSSRENLQIVSRHIKEAETRINSAMGSHWQRLSLGEMPRVNDAVLYGTVEELNPREFRKGEIYDGFLARLGGVMIFDAQTIDFTLLYDRIGLLRDALGEEYERLLITVQGGPMFDFDQWVGRPLFRDGRVTRVNLKQAQSGKRFVTVWNPDPGLTDDFHDAVSDLMPAGARDVPMLMAPQLVIAEHNLATAIHDPAGNEQLKAWTDARDRVSLSKARLNIGLTNVARDAVKRQKSDQEAAILVRDDGNLAATLMRDPVGDRVDDALVQIVTRPSDPFRDVVVGALQDHARDRHRDEFTMPALKKYLPRVPNEPAGLRDALRYIASRFLAADQNRISESELRKIIEERLRLIPLVAAMTDLETKARLKIDADAASLTHWFKRVFNETIPFIDASSRHHQRRIQATQTEPLGRIVAGEVNKVFLILDLDKPVMTLPKQDQGLTYEAGGLINFGRPRRSDRTLDNAVMEDTGITSHRLERAGDDFRLTPSGGQSGAVDHPHQMAFERHYSIGNVSLTGQNDSTRQLVFVPMFAQCKRHSPRMHDMARPETLPVEISDPYTPEWLAQFGCVLFARPGDENANAPSIALALALTLDTVLSRKFPSIAPRLAVVSPNLVPPNTTDIDTEDADDETTLQIDLTYLPPSIGRLELVDKARENIAACVRYKDRELAEGDRIELMIIEDADHSLGVIGILKNELDDIKSDLFEVWKDLLEHCAAQNACPYTKPKLGLRPDYARALALLTRGRDDD